MRHLFRILIIRPRITVRFCDHLERRAGLPSSVPATSLTACIEQSILSPCGKRNESQTSWSDRESGVRTWVNCVSICG
jgi:hypothetical protein